MAFPKKQASDPSQGNRAATIRFGTPEPEKIDIEALQNSVVDADTASVVSEGNITEPEPLPPQEQPPQATTEPAPAPTQEPAPAPESAAPKATTETGTTDEVDDPRFKGKSKAEIYKAYQNLERLKGEHDSELSNYRKLFMEGVLKPQFEKPAAPETPAPAPAATTDTDLLNEMLTNPSQFQKKTVAQAKQELLNELNGAARLNEIQQAKNAKQAIIDTPEFVNWLTSNVPQHVAAAADTDPTIFNFIMKSYEAFSGVAAAPAAPAKPTEPQPDRRVPIGPAAGVPAASASPGTKPVIFKQSELAEMMLYRPEEYARRQPEILAAYREGRIK
jgi:hypothetical protein